MKRLIIVAAGALALGGCAGAHVKAPVVCDGKHRRPANLYGSILPTLPVPLPASRSGGQSMVVPGPGPGPLPAPRPAPSPMPAPAPETGTSSAPTSKSLAAPPSASRTSSRDVALSYLPC